MSWWLLWGPVLTETFAFLVFIITGQAFSEGFVEIFPHCVEIETRRSGLRGAWEPGFVTKRGWMCVHPSLWTLVTQRQAPDKYNMSDVTVSQTGKDQYSKA